MKFHLVRYFLVTSLVAFLVVMVSLGYVQRKTAIDNLMFQAQANNVNTAQTFYNTLWTDFKPLVDRAKDLSVEQLQQDSEQARLYKLTADMMDNISVAKIKVFDVRGVTIFSTEASQTGSDKKGYPGFESAMKGIATSEMSHRDSFNAFDQVIEDRDMISSYIPVYSEDRRSIEGVFELYEDVTPIIEEINETQIFVVGTVVVMSALLYLALFMIVLRADKVLKAQALENERSQGQLVQSEKMASLGQMVAGVSHELNTPLAFIGSNITMTQEMLGDVAGPYRLGCKMIETLKGSDKDSITVKVNMSSVRSLIDDFYEVDLKEIEEMLTHTDEGVGQMQELVVNLKNFTRLDRAKVSDYDLNSGLRSVMYIAKSSMSTGIQVEEKMADIPQLRCMPSQINQVFMNLINNAGQAIGEEGKITLSTSLEGETVRIEVADNGEGISKESLPKVFEAFYTTKPEGEGTGLGLSICSDIITAHGGTIEAFSELGRGTRFVVKLPTDVSAHAPGLAA